MKAALTTPNTLYLAIWTENAHTVILANLRTLDGQIESVGQFAGTAPRGLPVAMLADCLRCLDTVEADHILIYTNDAKLAGLYKTPVHLEPKTPATHWRYVPDEWTILRTLNRYASWRLVQTDRLPNAKQFWEENKNNASHRTAA